MEVLGILVLVVNVHVFILLLLLSLHHHPLSFHILLLQLDAVALSSWQAQLKGKKTWTVAPQPECEHVCSTFNVTVNTGDLCELCMVASHMHCMPHPGPATCLQLMVHLWCLVMRQL